MAVGTDGLQVTLVVDSTFSEWHGMVSDGRGSCLTHGGTQPAEWLTLEQAAPSGLVGRASQAWRGRLAAPGLRWSTVAIAVT